MQRNHHLGSEAHHLVGKECFKDKSGIRVTAQSMKGSDTVNINFSKSKVDDYNIVMEVVQLPNFSGTVCISKKRLNRL